MPTIDLIDDEHADVRELQRRDFEGGNATGPGGLASAQQAQYRCPGATVVWVNENSHIYHFPGTRDYGNTKRGVYMCESDAQAAGNRAAKNERHP
jgi:hypothetical protein